MSLQVRQICEGAYCVDIHEIGVSWLLNAWPDVVKYIIKNDDTINGIVYTELTQSTDIVPDSNFLEFPLLHCLFNKGMIFDGNRPVVIGNKSQIIRAKEGFARGLYGFQNKIETLEDLTDEREAENLIKEIEGLGFNGIQNVENIVDFVPFVADINGLSCSYKGLKISSSSPNNFEFDYEGYRVDIDCNLAKDSRYKLPFTLNHSSSDFADFQVIDTGEADGFSENYSCNHTVVRWFGKTLCIDLPMNVSNMLFHAGISNSEIDAVVFTHNHDDHIGDLAFLFESSKKIDVICPKIIWSAITRKASTIYDCSEDQLSTLVNYIPIPFDKEFDYEGLGITPHRSIHPVPTAIYKFSVRSQGIYKTYVHLCDVLNFERCEKLLETGSISKDRFISYKKFMLQHATLKKVDVGTKKGGELFSVHGTWRDFVDDTSEEIILTHLNPELAEPQAIESVGSLSKYGSVRNLIEDSRVSMQELYEEKIMSYLCQGISRILDRCLNKDELSDIPEWHEILGTNVINVSPGDVVCGRERNTESIVLWLTGCGRCKIDKNGLQYKVQSGDIIGEIDAVLGCRESRELIAENYSRVVLISKRLFRRVVLMLCPQSQNQLIETLEEQDGKSSKLHHSEFYPCNGSLRLFNSLVKRMHEVELMPGSNINDGLYIGNDPRVIGIGINGLELEEKLTRIVAFGSFLDHAGPQTDFEINIRQPSNFLYLPADHFKWFMNIPILKYRLREIVRWRVMCSLFCTN